MRTIWFLNLIIFLAAGWSSYAVLRSRSGPASETGPESGLERATGRLLPGRYRLYLTRLLTAARRHPAPGRFLARQIVWSGGFVTAGALARILSPIRDIPAGDWLLLAPVLLAAGFSLPLIGLIRFVRSRERQILRDFPFYLDLMTLGVESGMDYLNVLNRIMILSRPGPFREELEIVAGQIRMGKQRAEAWLELGERIRLREIRSLVLTLVQTDRNGTPLSDSLLGLSRDAREESFRRAEKRAFEMPVKMLFPLLGFIFPAVFILIFEPLLLRFLRLL